jgi:hypothetical protein
MEEISNPKRPPPMHAKEPTMYYGDELGDVAVE